jgi:hypothetical protein
MKEYIDFYAIVLVNIIGIMAIVYAIHFGMRILTKM